MLKNLRKLMKLIQHYQMLKKKRMYDIKKTILLWVEEMEEWMEWIIFSEDVFGGNTRYGFVAL